MASRGVRDAQLAALLAITGQGAAYNDPGQRAMMESILGSAQSNVASQNAKAAAKKKKSGIGGLLGGAAAVAAAPFTGGTSLSFLPAAMAAGNGAESMINGDVAGGGAELMGAVSTGYGVYNKRNESTDALVDANRAHAEAQGIDLTNPFATPAKGRRDGGAPVSPESSMVAVPGVATTTSNAMPAAPPVGTGTVLAPPPVSAATPAKSATTAMMGALSSAAPVPGAGGLTAFGRQQEAKNAAAANPETLLPTTTALAPPKIGGRPGIPNVSEMSPRSIRGMSDYASISAISDQPMTLRQALAYGKTPEEIRDMRRKGLIIQGNLMPAMVSA